MAIRLTTTKECGKFAKVLVFGKSGVGKTKLIGTAPKPIIISGENGLLSLNTGPKIPVIEVKNHLDLDEAYTMVMSPKCAKFETVSLDSVSEIAENCLQYFKDNPPDGNPDPRAAHGAMIDALMPILKKFRDINNKHVYFIAQLKRTEDQYTGIDTFAPSAPGRVIGPKLPYWFDFVLPMRIGEKEGGGKYRYLQTQPCLQYVAKSRGENLRDMEPPNLTTLFKKVLVGPAATPKTKPAPTAEDNAQAKVNAGKQAKIKEQAELAKAEEVAKKKAAAAKRKKASQAKKEKEEAAALAVQEAKEEEETETQTEEPDDAAARAEAALASLEASSPANRGDGSYECGFCGDDGDTDDFPGDDGGFPE